MNFVHSIPYVDYLCKAFYLHCQSLLENYDQVLNMFESHFGYLLQASELVALHRL